MPVNFDIYTEPKFDSHCHVLDPARFACSADYFFRVMAACGVRHALLVGPNSGYGFDHQCLLDAIALGQGRFKGMAVAPGATSTAQLQAFARRVADPAHRRTMLRKTAMRWFGFGDPAAG